MTRIEIIANQSVQDAIISELEEDVPDFLYTIIPLAYGRGEKDRKLGSPIWPETNFVLLAYVKDTQAELVMSIVDQLKRRFKTEGIKIFCIRDGQ